MGPGSSPYSEPPDLRALDQLRSTQPQRLPPHLVEQPGEFWRREPKRRYIIFFLLTLCTTTLAGLGVSVPDLWEHPELLDLLLSTPILANGLWFSLPALAILGAHEFGHYFACVRYRVNASLPYFLPLPFAPFGTLGAVIRIRQPLPGKSALFDIGIAGPLAGFAVLVPFLLIGVMLSTVGPVVAGRGEELGEPLLFKLAAWVVFGPIPDGQTVFIHPIGLAAWFGMLATALNLFPVGQLDGGHISYALLGPLSTRVTIVALVFLVGLTVFASASWIVWTVLIVAMMVVTGPQHPRVWDEHVPLDRGRVILAVVAMLVFVICFMPAPLPQLDALLSWN